MLDVLDGSTNLKPFREIVGKEWVTLHVFPFNNLLSQPLSSLSIRHTYHILRAGHRTIGPTMKSSKMQAMTNEAL